MGTRYVQHRLSLSETPKKLLSPFLDRDTVHVTMQRLVRNVRLVFDSLRMTKYTRPNAAAFT
jgi:hypothetical protein